MRHGHGGDDDGRRSHAPVALIHGLFGWGEVTPLWGAAPTYFPLKEIRRARPKGLVVAVDIGAMSSNHDRACEAFAQLYGIRTDYGAPHAAQCGHHRYGEDYTGKALLPCWNAAHPVHIIGHSFGGNTGLALVSLLASDFWGIGTSASWILSIATVCSPLRGCMVPYAWGYDVSQGSGSKAATHPKPSSAIRSGVRAKNSGRQDSNGCDASSARDETGAVANASAAKAEDPDGSCDLSTTPTGANAASAAPAAGPLELTPWRRTGQIPRLFSVVHGLCILIAPPVLSLKWWPWLKGLYDFRLDRFAEHFTWQQALTMRNPFWINGDNMLVDATPGASASALRAVRPHLARTYLVSVTCDQTEPIRAPDASQVRRAKIIAATAACTLSLCLCRHRKALAAAMRRGLMRVLDGFEAAVLTFSQRLPDATLVADVKHAARQGGMKRYALYLAALAAVLRHRTARRLRSPKLALIVAVSTASILAAAATAAAAAATVLGIPFRWWAVGEDGERQQLKVLRPILEGFRPALHAYLLPWLVRPALRLNSAAIHRTAALLQGDLRVTFAFRTDTNDGIVDLSSHRGVDSVTAPLSPTRRRRPLANTDAAGAKHQRGGATPGSGLREVASAEELRNISHISPRVVRGGNGRGEGRGNSRTEGPAEGRPARGTHDGGAEGAVTVMEEGGGEGGSLASLLANDIGGEKVGSPARNFSHHAFGRLEAGHAADIGTTAAGSPVPMRLSSVVGSGWAGSLGEATFSAGEVNGEKPHLDVPPLPPRLDRGRWHIMRVPGADHSLGTWASDKSDEMYRELLVLLDAQQEYS